MLTESKRWDDNHQSVWYHIFLFPLPFVRKVNLLYHGMFRLYAYYAKPHSTWVGKLKQEHLQNYISTCREMQECILTPSRLLVIAVHTDHSAQAYDRWGQIQPPVTEYRRVYETKAQTSSYPYTVRSWWNEYSHCCDIIGASALRTHNFQYMNSRFRMIRAVKLIHLLWHFCKNWTFHKLNMKNQIFGPFPFNEYWTI